MRKIFLFLAPMLLLVIAYGCSKDHEAPTFGKYSSIMKQPTSFVAVYNKQTKAFDMTWNMPDTSAVKTYNVAWSDSNVFDLGHVQNKNTEALNTTWSVPATDVLKTMGYTAKKDSFIVYFTVSAIYAKTDMFNDFIGPRAVVDSALILDYAKK